VRRRPDSLFLGLLLVVSFLMDVAFRAGAQGYQESGLALKASALNLSRLGALSAFCYTVMCLVAGSVSDRIGRKATAVLACVGLATAYALAGLAGSIGRLLLLSILSGSSGAFFWPAIQAWIADLSGRGRQRLARRLGLFNVAWAAGLTVGPTYIGFVWAFGAALGLSQRIAFWSTAGVVLLIAAIVLITRARPADPDPVADENHDEARVHPHQASLLFGARVGTFASWFAVGVIIALFPKLAEELGYDERVRGVLASCYHVGQLGLFVLALKPGQWQLRRWPLVLALGLSLAGMLSLVWARSPTHFGLVFAVAGACASVAYTASLFHSLHGRVGDRGKLAGIHEAILASGSFLSPLIAGFLAEYISLRAPFVLVTVILAGAIVAQVVAWRNSMARAAIPEEVG
jgi:MFS family permease